MSGSGPIYEYQREVTAQLEQALRERDEARAEAGKLREAVNAWAKTAEWNYQRGAEAMREAAANAAAYDPRMGGSTTADFAPTPLSRAAARIRALPIPEDK